MTTIGFGNLPQYNFYPKRPVVKEENNNKTENNAGNTDKAPQPNVAKTIDLNQLGLYNTISLKPISVVGTEEAKEPKAQKSDRTYSYSTVVEKGKVYLLIDAVGAKGKKRVLSLKVTIETIDGKDIHYINGNITNDQIRNDLIGMGYTFPNNKSK